MGFGGDKLNRQKHFREKTLVLLNIFALIFIFASLGIGIFLSQYPFNAFELEVPMIVSTNQIPAGGVIQFNASFCSHITGQAQVTRKIESELVTITLPDVKVPLQKGCSVTEGITVQIPAHTPPGIYKYTSTLNFQVNPLQRQTHIIYTEPFEVLNESD